MWSSVVQLLVLVAAGVTAREISDEEYAQFPRLYHLDDFEGCLARTDGLYCLGTFQIEKPKQYDSTYELIKVYSENPHHFNRTRLHRGYCVSERCPSSERNLTLRFERCASQWGRKRKLRLSLQKLTYCRTHAQEYARRHSPEPLDLPQRTLLLVVAALCLANLLGTVYDVLVPDVEKKNIYLLSWSIRSNWQRLVDQHEDGDPQLAALNPVQGIRVFLMILIIGTHAACIHDMLYLHNPHYVEMVAKTPYLMAFMNGTSVVMVFVLISSFLLAYNLLLLSKKTDLNMGMLKWCLVKRIARISPVSLLVVGYAATFWPHVTGGPMWPTLVEPESKICREKFWSHALYINNLWRADDHCLVQTWFLGTDLQLYVVATALTIRLARARLRAVLVLAALLLASCALNGGLAYFFDWQPLMYHVYPETLHTMYHGVPSFYRLYTAPWGSLPACLVGLLLAHLHHELRERGLDPTAYKWFRCAYTLSFPAMVSWLVAGHWVRRVTAREVTALYAALERPVLSLLAALALLAMFNGARGFMKNYFSWRGWQAMGRMSLSVLMVHWIINTCIAASRPQPISTSLLDVVVDTAGTGLLSYLVAIPLTLMVEMPFTRVTNALLIISRDKPKKKEKETQNVPKKTIKEENVKNTETMSVKFNAVETDEDSEKKSKEKTEKEKEIKKAIETSTNKKNKRTTEEEPEQETAKDTKNEKETVNETENEKENKAKEDNDKNKIIEIEKDKKMKEEAEKRTANAKVIHTEKEIEETVMVKDITKESEVEKKDDVKTEKKTDKAEVNNEAATS